jgi:FkbM family methyltransferase
MADLPPPLMGMVTHADHGEDVIIKVIFDMLGVEKPSYLDVGAFDPFIISNTALLYARGSRGINIEPNPKLMGAFMKHRPGDLNLNCAVGTERLAARTLYIGENPGLASFHREHAGDRVLEEIDVPTWTITDILVGHRGGAWPDLLTIDIEGEDLTVLSQCLPAEGDRPTVVVVESLRMTEDYSAEWLKLMPSRRYALAFRTRSNMIWVKDGWSISSHGW